ncbi:hypothetical protein K432DRAFT_393424 [Lepidopterella palustris CBS 459.81]|uniref:Uncharacterized protein n=1 Tax=Lepidopterella palustris CBS 459.81 TaxID=1314670 RepID=A0A8E2JEV9_9PEZI|nr:hypothetical protein K432DRAFT_393424 [Lepidopterella palustris CBS 459.81]
MVHLGETITVINKSGKVVSNSKHLINVFKEAKSAYRERKAEIQAERNAAAEEKNARHGVKSLRIDDDTRSRASSRASKGPSRSKSHRHARPSIERGHTDSFYVNDERPRRHSPTHRHLEQDLAGDGHRRELSRRHTDGPVQLSAGKTTRSHSEPHIDMDLAYGELPPPPPMQRYEEGELREKASRLTMLLDEANCLQYSVTAMIENLQKNPEALAAVALTLAEISNIVGKMGPGVLMTMKSSFPAVVALLASPQFMIAAGVGVGVTIVALGGYKIIKKIKAKKENELEEPLQLDELQTPELSRIEMWRRGIAEIEAESNGTSVDGEFITPGASRHLIAAGVIEEDGLKARRASRDKERAESKSKHKAPKSTKSSKTSRGGKDDKDKKKKKKKEPSGLRMLFQSHAHS